MLARVYRGPHVESTHRGSVAVVDERGRLLHELRRRAARRSTRARRPSRFRRCRCCSAGGEKRFRLGRAEIALLCASHGGRAAPRAAGRGLLRRGGFRVEDLQCGAHAPMHEASARDLVRRGELPDGAPQQLLRKARRPAARVPGARPRPATGYTDAAPSAAAEDPDAARAVRRRARIADHLRRRRLQPPGLPAAALGAGAGLCAPRALRAAGRGSRRPRRRARASSARCRKRPTWSPEPGGSRPTFSRPGAAAGSARRAPRASTRWARPRRRGGRRSASPSRSTTARRARATPSRSPPSTGSACCRSSSARALASYAEPPSSTRADSTSAHRGGRRRSPAAPGEPEALPMAFRTSPRSSRRSRRDGDLVRVRERVSPRLEIAEIADRAVKGGRSGAPLRERRGFDVAGRDQPLRARAAGCSRPSASPRGRSGTRVSSSSSTRKPPEGLLDKLKALPKLTELAASFRRRSGAGRARRSSRRATPSTSASFPSSPAGPRTPAPSSRCRSSSRRTRPGQDERRHVPHAGLRPRDDRNALAEAQGRRGPGARLRARGPPHGSRRRHRLRSGDGLLRDRAAAARRLRVPLRGIPPRRSRSARAGEDRRPARPGGRGVRPRGLRRSGRAAPRRARSATTPASTRSTTTSRSST